MHASMHSVFACSWLWMFLAALSSAALTAVMSCNLQVWIKFSLSKLLSRYLITRGNGGRMGSKNDFGNTINTESSKHKAGNWVSVRNTHRSYKKSSSPTRRLSACSKPTSLFLCCDNSITKIRWAKCNTLIQKYLSATQNLTLSFNIKYILSL